jgi:hypothetical protein
LRYILIVISLLVSIHIDADDAEWKATPLLTRPWLHAEKGMEKVRFSAITRAMQWNGENAELGAVYVTGNGVYFWRKANGEKQWSLFLANGAEPVKVIDDDSDLLGPDAVKRRLYAPGKWIWNEKQKLYATNGPLYIGCGKPALRGHPMCSPMRDPFAGGFTVKNRGVFTLNEKLLNVVITGDSMQLGAETITLTDVALVYAAPNGAAVAYFEAAKPKKSAGWLRLEGNTFTPLWSEGRDLPGHVGIVVESATAALPIDNGAVGIVKVKGTKSGDLLIRKRGDETEILADSRSAGAVSFDEVAATTDGSIVVVNAKTAAGTRLLQWREGKLTPLHQGAIVDPIDESNDPRAMSAKKTIVLSPHLVVWNDDPLTIALTLVFITEKKYLETMSSGGWATYGNTYIRRALYTASPEGLKPSPLTLKVEGHDRVREVAASDLVVLIDRSNVIALLDDGLYRLTRK